ncbi:serine O-acetyltransferase EpsC [Anaerotruncus colihominis]|uniref:serine O-acetyltransferase EpsC n=2 Tax=Anaerotruncus colihominis TaxID=169435 RepID=UPI001FADF3FE|nr:serine O-acetyltransferase EpsC [Anaerotruncus colihominis]
MFDELKKDIQAVKERDPAARSSLEVLLISSGLHALMLHRPAHWLYLHKAFLPARLISQAARFLTGVEIHPGAKIGSGVMIDHGMGIVIGETAEVGDGCTIYQGVTLGGTGKDKGKRHPTLGKNVTVGCGAKILGPFKVGDGAKVAANAVLLESIPAQSTAVGVPARVARVGGRKPTTLDHVHIPDPVAQEICRLRFEIGKMEQRIRELEKKEQKQTQEPIHPPRAAAADER